MHAAALQPSDIYTTRAFAQKAAKCSAICIYMRCAAASQLSDSAAHAASPIYIHIDIPDTQLPRS